jgi:guanylate kinase
MNDPGKRGMLIVVSAPSGAGKGTLLSEALQRDARLRPTISVTTREPRDGEVPGRDYEFIDPQTFQNWIAEDRLLEWAEVHDNYYGTPRDAVHRAHAAGHDAVLEIDVQGMRRIRAMHPDAVTVFIMPPSLEELERRLRVRGGMSEDAIQTRLRNAEAEMAARNEFDHVLINAELEAAVAQFLDILKNERKRLEIS